MHASRKSGVKTLVEFLLTEPRWCQQRKGNRRLRPPRRFACDQLTSLFFHSANRIFGCKIARQRDYDDCQRTDERELQSVRLEN